MTTETIEKPSAPEKFYRIISLQVSNIKRVKAVSIQPATDVVTIGGKNRAGKSSVLDAMLYAFAGAGVVCDRPIREGQSEGKVSVDLGDLIITKQFSAASAPKLRVTMKDGSPVSSPQTILDRLCSRLAFDPMEFYRQKPDVQLENLKKLVGLDFTALTKKRDEVYGARTLVNRDIAAKKAQLAAKLFHEDAPPDEVSVKSLMADLSMVNARNRSNDFAKENLKNISALVKNQRHDIAVCQNQIDELLKQVEAKKDSKTKMEADLAGLEAAEKSKMDAVNALVYEDTTPIANRISDADSTNAKVRANADHNRLKSEIEQLEKQELEHTQHIDRIDAEKRSKLENAKFPTPGLSFGDSGVLLKGMPFDQASTSERIQASMAIAIAMNPKLRVVIIRDGSLLDAESMAIVTKMAQEHDVQVWVEVISDTKDKDSKCSVIIENGELKSE